MPVQIDSYEEMEPGEFDTLENPKPQARIDPLWEEILSKLADGREIRLPVPDEGSLRGLRLAVGRRAVGRGFRVETRTQTRDGKTYLAVRKTDEPSAPKAPRVDAEAPEGTTRRRGRPRKAAEAPTGL